MRREVIAVRGECGVFGEDKNGDDSGFAHILVTVLKERCDSPIEHRAQFPEGRHGGAGREEARAVFVAPHGPRSHREL
ncbi:hypothetical protein [Streptomyces roseicoloratus]|uniref:hypothetical protein n=1 Tax=Streptomyces roseicoloratus TaxID=2508722 RepID=UPI0013E917EE|nr:hypothetical protein [Streptomyces roseicoloratus]